MTAETIPELLQRLDSAPSFFVALVSDLSAEQARAKHAADAFSVVENICHLRDIEIEGYCVRISRILQENSPVLPDINGSLLAVERNYNQQSINTALEQFERARQANVELLQGLDNAQLDREGLLEHVGTISLRRLIYLMCEHDDGHLEEIRAIREKLEAIGEKPGAAAQPPSVRKASGFPPG